MLVWSFVAFLILCLGAYNVIKLTLAFRHGNAHGLGNQSFSAQPSDDQRHILVVGGSTAFGTGAECADDSVAGRIAREFPFTQIENHSARGAVVADLCMQLREAKRQVFDLVLIQVGSNDALNLNRLRTLRDDIANALGASTALGTRVALLSTPDLGAAPAIPWPLSYLFTVRSRSINEIFEAMACIKGAQYVDLRTTISGSDPFIESPGLYYAPDGLHPSSEGYGAWYERLRAALPLDRWLV